MKNTIISKDLKPILNDFGISVIISDDIDYIDVGEDENSISYIPIAKISRIKEKGLNPWKDGRVNMKVGKFFNKVMMIENADLENLVNWYKTMYFISKGNFDNIFQIVDGEDIRFWYNEENYVKGGGTLNGSCMRGEHSQGKLDMYVENPECCKLLIMKQGDKLLSRALMWTTTDNRVYIDRVYTRYDKDCLLYKKYADHNKYLNYYNRGGGSELTMTLRRRYMGEVPYLDTFRLSEKYVQNVNNTVDIFSTLTANI